MAGIDEAEFSGHTARMREQTEESIRLMEQLFRNCNSLFKSEKALEHQLSIEQENRILAEDRFAASERHRMEVEAKAEQLEGKVSSLEEKVHQTEVKLMESDRAKEASVATLSSDLAQQEKLMAGLKYMRRNVDSFRLGTEELMEPNSALMLADGRVLVADTVRGLLLYSAQTELLKCVQNEEVWKWPQGLVYDPFTNRLLVSMVRKEKGGERWFRAITYYSLELDELEFMEGPLEAIIEDKTAKERLALSNIGELFMTVCDRIGSAIYKWTPDGHWQLLTKRQGASFTDCQVLAVLGPITELLVIESRMGYIHRFSVDNSSNDIFDRKSLAVVEQPGAMCVDDRGRLFIHDTMSGKIRLVDTHRFEPTKDICLVDESVFSITASHGYLGVAVRQSRLVRVFRYDRDVNEQLR